MLFLLITTIGCVENDEDVLPAVTAEFTYSLNSETGTVRFINTSENATNYSWDFGNGKTSTEVNPIQTFEEGSYTVTLTSKNSAGDSDSFNDDILYTKLDTQAPVITLLGDATMNISLGDTFTDPGATASDDVNGNITDNIVVGGDTVDTNTEATYTITYNVSDTAGNAATEVTRTVIITDNSCKETNLSLPIDFECDGTDYASKDSGDVAFEVIDNPEMTGIHATASKVGKLVFDSNQQWENMNLTLDTPIDFTTEKLIKFKFYATEARAIKLKFEGSGAPTETDANHTGTGWEELSFEMNSSASFTNLIVFVDGGADTAGTFYIDDITQSVATNNGGGGGGTTGDYLYATTATANLTSTIEDWGSGTTIVTDYSGDGTYNPCIQLTSGTAWGDVSALAFTGLETGLLANYSTIEFKIKSTDYTTFRIKVPENELSFNIADGTALTDGWVQISLPLSNWSGEVAAADQFAILEFGAGTMLITDVMLSGEGGNSGGGGGTGDCPAPPSGELLSNGDFEAGDAGCWQFFAGSSISSTVNNGGSKSAEIQGSTGAAVGLKQERFGAGTILPNTSYTVTFDIMADGDFGIGGLMKAFAFSEGADGGTVGATLHTLTDNTTAIATSWETKTFTFTTPANANQVEGGISFLIEVVNSNVKLNIDNVVVKKTP